MLKSIDKCLQILAKPASLPNLFRAYNGNGKYRKKSALEGTVAKDRVHDSYFNMANIHLFLLTVLSRAQAFSTCQTDDNGQANTNCSNLFKATWERLFLQICSNPLQEKTLC